MNTKDDKQESMQTKKATLCYYQRDRLEEMTKTSNVSCTHECLYAFILSVMMFYQDPHIKHIQGIRVCCI